MAACNVFIKRAWPTGYGVRPRSQVRIPDVATFLLNPGLFLLFLFPIYKAAFCRVRASLCEAKLCLCLRRSLVHFLCEKEGKLHYRTPKVKRSQKTRSTCSSKNGI